MTRLLVSIGEQSVSMARTGPKRTKRDNDSGREGPSCQHVGIGGQASRDMHGHAYEQNQTTTASQWPSQATG